MTTKLSLFTSLLRKYFFGRLDRKTGWGNQEVRLEFEQAITEALSDIIDKNLIAVASDDESGD